MFTALILMTTYDFFKEEFFLNCWMTIKDYCCPNSWTKPRWRMTRRFYNCSVLRSFSIPSLKSWFRNLLISCCWKNLTKKVLYLFITRCCTQRCLGVFVWQTHKPNLPYLPIVWQTHKPNLPYLLIVWQTHKPNLPYLANLHNHTKPYQIIPKHT